MVKKLSSALLAALILGATSCSDDNPWLDLPDGRGAIKLNLAADADLKESVPVTRADGTYRIDESLIPKPEHFDIHLARTDGSESKHFSYESFINTNSFATGNYTLKASAGNPDLEGYDCPYFEGITEVLVLEGKEAEVSVNATVKRALINVTVSEGFDKYLKDYSVSVHSEGHDYIPIARDEEKPVYLIPGSTTLGVTLTNLQGESVTIEPDNFITQAGHHYNINLKVSDSSKPGVGKFEIEFNNDLVKEDFFIDLTDELFTSPAPVVKLSGLPEAEEGQENPVLEFLAGEAPEGNYRFTVLSYGGLKEVKMTLTGTKDEFFAGDVQLLKADMSTQQKLAAYGITAKGLYSNPEKMAYIDFSQLPANLPDGNYTLIVEAKDQLNRTSNIAKVTINSVKASLTIVPKDALYGAFTGTLLIDYNGSKPATDITFMADNKYGKMVEAPLVCDPEISQTTRSFESKSYVYTIKLPEFGGRAQERVDVYLYGQFYETVYLNVVTPSYNVVSDAFAHKVMIKPTDIDPDLLPAIVENLKVYDSGNALIPESRIERNSESGILTVSGLESNKSYTLSTSLISLEGSDLKTLEFKTENEDQIPNGDFSDSINTINLPNINVSGIFQISVLMFRSNTQLYTTISKDTPTGWATLNQLTCFPGSTNKNTWYMVPSTWVENEQAVIQSVGYHHSGEEIPSDIKGTSTAYYSTKVPETLNVSTGELFLGNYPFGESVSSKSEGMGWSTRPSSLTFDYRYVPQVSSEEGEAYIQIFGAGNSVLSEQKVYIPAASSMTKMTVNLPDYRFGEKAESIRISFKSTRSDQTPEIHKPSGTELKEDEVNAQNYRGPDAKLSGTTYNGTLHIDTYKAKATGSTLTIDNVVLGYDGGSAASNAKRKNNKKR